MPPPALSMRPPGVPRESPGDACTPPPTSPGSPCEGCPGGGGMLPGCPGAGGPVCERQQVAVREYYL
eukprot:6793662-Pyramimonas_sp.AAC.1